MARFRIKEVEVKYYDKNSGMEVGIKDSSKKEYEKDLENYFFRNPNILFKEGRLIARQLNTPRAKYFIRGVNHCGVIDLFGIKNKELICCEIAKDATVSTHDIKQIEKYIRFCQKAKNNRRGLTDFIKSFFMNKKTHERIHPDIHNEKDIERILSEWDGQHIRGIVLFQKYKINSKVIRRLGTLQKNKKGNDINLNLMIVSKEIGRGNKKIVSITNIY